MGRPKRTSGTTINTSDMKTSTSKILFSIFGVIVSFGLGYLLASPSFNENSAKGDIAKVSKFHKSVVSPQASAFQEKIMNDPEELQRTKASLTLLGSRMTEFDNLVDMSLISCEGISELAPSVFKLTKIRSLSDNAKESAIEAIDAFNSMVAGTKNSASDYESASQRLSLAYLMVDRQITVGKEFVTDVDAYFKGKNVEDNMELALSRELWAVYCAGEAVLNGDKEELAYWTNKESIVTDDALGMFANHPEATIQDLDFESVVNTLEAMCQIVEFGINADAVANNGKSEEMLQSVGFPIMGYYLRYKNSNSSTTTMNATNAADDVMNATDQIRVVRNGEGFSSVLNLQESTSFLTNDIKNNTVNAIGLGTILNLADFALTCTSVTMQPYE